MPIIINRRCDEPMRRSKERCITPAYRKWKCSEDCRNCICCIQMDENGNEEKLKKKEQIEMLTKELEKSKKTTADLPSFFYAS